MRIEWLHNLGTPLGMVLLSLIAGLVAEWLVTRLIRLMTNTHWPGRVVLIGGLRGAITTWFVLVGLYVAVLSLRLNQRALDLAAQILTVFFILSLTLTLARIVSGLLRLYTQRESAVLPATSIIINLSRLLVLVVGGLLILGALNINITPILTTLGVGALAVALALQDTLSNLFAGLQLIAARQIRPGDHIRLDEDSEGTVEDIGWRTTTIRQLGGSVIIMPNSRLAQAVVVNHDLHAKDVGVSVDLAVGYRSNLARVEALTIEVAREVMQQVPGGIPDFEPSLSYGRIGDYSIHFSVNMRAATFPDQFQVRHEFIRRLLPRYNAEGIAIPYPIQIEMAYDTWQEQFSAKK